MDDPLDIGFAGRPAFHDAVRRLLGKAGRAGWRELLCCDADFSAWPLGAPDVVASLSAWVGPRRRLSMLASGYDNIVRRHPRWVEWRRVWSHATWCRQIADESAGQDVPTLLIAPGKCALRLLDRVRWRGVISTAGPDVTRAQGEFDAISQRSVEAFGATTLGL